MSNSYGRALGGPSRNADLKKKSGWSQVEAMMDDVGGGQGQDRENVAGGDSRLECKNLYGNGWHWNIVASMTL